MAIDLEKARERRRRWREKNPDYNRQYYLRNRERVLAQQKAERKKDVEAARERQREWYRRNPEPQRNRSRQYREEHPEYLETIREWHRTHPERVRALGRKSQQKRRARKLALPYEDVDPELVFQRDGGICGICGEPVEPTDWELDHIIPLAMGGHHLYANVQTAHPFCNRSKGGRGHERQGAFP